MHGYVGNTPLAMVRYIHMIGLWPHSFHAMIPLLQNIIMLEYKPGVVFSSWLYERREPMQHSLFRISFCNLLTYQMPIVSEQLTKLTGAASALVAHLACDHWCALRPYPPDNRLVRYAPSRHPVSISDPAFIFLRHWRTPGL